MLTPFGINYAELAMLGVLRTSGSEGRSSLTRLRRLVGQSSAGTTRILDKLEAAGWVRREGLEGDRRRVSVRLTGRGAALADASLGALLGEQRAILARLDRGQRRALVAALDTLLGSLAARRGA